MYGPSGRPSIAWRTIAARLPDLGHAHAVAVVAVAHGADGDPEVEVVVRRIRVRLAQVPRVAGRAQQRTGHAQLEQPLLGDDADVLRALQEDLVAVEDRLVLADALLHVVGEARAPCRPSRRGCPPLLRRPGRSACACAGRTSTRTGRAPCRARGSSTRRSRSRRGRARDVPSHTRCEWIRFSSQWITRRYCARAGHLLVEQPLDRHAERHRVEVVGEVVHPLDERDHLPVRLVLAALLDAGVDVADVRVRLEHLLARAASPAAAAPRASPGGAARS